MFSQERTISATCADSLCWQSTGPHQFKLLHCQAMLLVLRPPTAVFAILTFLKQTAILILTLVRTSLWEGDAMWYQALHTNIYDNFFLQKKNIFSPCLRFAFLSETFKFFCKVYKVVFDRWLAENGSTFVIAEIYDSSSRKGRDVIFSQDQKIDSLASGYKLKPSGKPWATNDS